MTNEQKVLLKILGAALNDTKPNIQSPETVNWQEVMEESEAQSVLPMAFDSVEEYKENIPKEVYKAWSKRAITYLIKNAKVHSVQEDLVNLLAEAGYPYAIIKGEVSAQYYNCPHLRILGDVDFLISPEQNDELASFLCSKGYLSRLEEHDCHIVFKRPNGRLEMHRYIQGIPDGEVGKRLREATETILKECEKSSDGNFNVPTKYHHALILILHSQHHMTGEGLGLRHLLDFTAFLDKTQNEAFWEEKLLGILENTGLLTFTKVLAKTCSTAFDVSCPKWADADENLCGLFLADVFSSGNFGRKDDNRVRTGILIKNKSQGGVSQGKYKRMYRILVRNIKNKHPKAKKYPILYPVYFITETFRYMGLVLMGKRPSLNKISKDVDKRKNVYQQLKIFEV